MNIKYIIDPKYIKEIFVFVFLFIFSFLAAAYSGGSGTQLDPYQIASKTDLLELSNDPANYDKSFILTTDIDLLGETFARALIAPDTNNEKDSGYQGIQFTGVFDGDGYVIMNLTINAPTADYIGLFGYVSNAIIQNLGIENVSIVGRQHIGCLAGYNTGSTLSACCADGSIVGVFNLGGLVGKSVSGAISTSYAAVSIRGISDPGAPDTFNIGGLVGRNSGTITACYATGLVRGTFNIGGLAGLNSSGTITTCYSTGSVSAIGHIGIGGLVGQNESGSTTASFWDIQTSGQSTSAGGQGKTTAQMLRQSTFTAVGWDFVGQTSDGTEDIWQIQPAMSPHLSWEIIPPLKAISPQPANGAANQSVDIDVTWANGGAATSYDIYFGTSPSLAGEDYKGNQTTAVYDLPTLDFETTYYWRIDAINPIGTATGDVWQFTTESVPVIPPLKAVSPAPSNEAANQSVNPVLTWLNGGHADSFDIYFGTDPDLGIEDYQGNQITAVYEPPTLAFNTTYYWRIDAVNPNGTAAGDLWCFTTEPVPVSVPLKPAGPAPSDAAVNQSVNADISWTNGGGAASFNVYFGTDSTPDSTEYMGNQTRTTFDPGSLSYGEIYYWRIDAVNQHGTTTGDLWRFATESITAPLPLNAANPDPSDTAVNVSVNTDLSWSNGGDATSFNVYFGTDPTPDTTEYMGSRIHTSFDPGVLTYDATYYWRIDSVNSSGTKTGDVWRFTTQPVPDGFALKAVMPVPANEAINQSANTDITWTNGGNASSFDVYFGRDSIPDSTEYMGSQTHTTFDPGSLAYDAIYYWRIDSVNSNGTTTGDVWQFTTESVSVSAPLKAVTPGPSDGATNQSVNPAISWTNGGGAAGFDVYLGTNSLLGGEDYKGSQTDTVYEPQTLAFNTTYYWRIDAVNPGGITTGDLWQFTTQPVPGSLPLKPVTPGPSNESTSQSVITDITWANGGDAISYNVYFGTDSTPDNTEFIANQTHTSFAPGLLEYDELYYWRIDAINPNGTTTGDLWRFTTESIPIAPPLKTADPDPLNLSASQSVNTILTWTNGGAASGFNIYFGTDATPDSTEYMGSQTGTSFDVGTLAYDEIYYWRIDAVNLNGTTTGDLWQFTTESVPAPLPLKAAAPTPANGAINQSVNTDLAWTNGGGAAGYDVYFGANPELGSEDYKGNQTSVIFDLPELSFNTTYYWRIDSVNLNGTTAGDVWQLTTQKLPGPPPQKAANPAPANGAVNQFIDTDLTWTNGGGAASYDVYFGTNPVLDSNDFKGSQTTVIYEPSALAFNTTYYWRIDAVNSDGTTTGDLWRFTTESSESRQLEVQKCVVKAGRSRGLDSLQISGLLNASQADILAADELVVKITADMMPSPMQWTFPVDGKSFRNGRFAARTKTDSLNFTVKTGKMQFSARKIDLTGLSCPVAVAVTAGSHSAAKVLEESVVNGPRALCPVQFLMGVKDTLTVTKYKVVNKEKPNMDSFTAQGTFSIAAGLEKSEPFIITLGTQTFTIPGGQFTGKNNIESLKKTSSAEGAVIDAKFDFTKGLFTISVKNTDLTQSGTADFKINCFGANLQQLAAITIN